MVALIVAIAAGYSAPLLRASRSAIQMREANNYDGDGFDGNGGWQRPRFGQGSSLGGKSFIFDDPPHREGPVHVPSGPQRDQQAGARAASFREYVDGSGSARHNNFYAPPVSTSAVQQGRVRSPPPAAPAPNGGAMAEQQPVSSSSGGPTEGAERIAISWKDHPPANAYPGSVALLGTFVKQPQLVNGHPCYANEERPSTMLWFSPNQYWSIGVQEHLGGGVSAVHSLERGLELPEAITGEWHISDIKNEGWLKTSHIKVAVQPPTSRGGGDAPADSSRRSSPLPAGSLKERKLAIDAETEAERKHAKKSLETRVTKARALCDAAADAKYRRLINLAFEEYAADEIDEKELKLRKKVAREQATAEVGVLSDLDTAYGAYLAATAARGAAQEALRTALQAEDLAADKVHEALASIEQHVKSGGDGEGRGQSGGPDPEDMVDRVLPLALEKRKSKSGVQ